MKLIFQHCPHCGPYTSVLDLIFSKYHTFVVLCKTKLILINTRIYLYKQGNQLVLPPPLSVKTTPISCHPTICSIKRNTSDLMNRIETVIKWSIIQGINWNDLWENGLLHKVLRSFKFCGINNWFCFIIAVFWFGLLKKKKTLLPNCYNTRYLYFKNILFLFLMGFFLRL